jgi:hypothetical protein
MRILKDAKAHQRIRSRLEKETGNLNNKVWKTGNTN